MKLKVIYIASNNTTEGKLYEEFVFNGYVETWFLLLQIVCISAHENK